MIDDTIQRIEKKLAESAISDERRADLVKLLATLREEVGALSESDADRAERIAGFTQVTAHEAIRSDQDASLLQHGLEGLASSVKELEVSHPRLFGVVNAICHRLSELGI